MSVLSKILEHKIIAIIRGAHPAHVIDIATALHAGGIYCMEVTMNSEEPLATIQQLAKRFSGKMLIGAGTVVSEEMVEQAVSAGAEFIISPIVNNGIITLTKKLGAVSIPGAFTATEIFDAHGYGADIIKVFPATSPSYIKDILGPFPQIPLLPTGGINVSNIKDYRRAGAVGMGIGSSLVNNKKEINDSYFANLTELAKQFVIALETP